MTAVEEELEKQGLRQTLLDAYERHERQRAIFEETCKNELTAIYQKIVDITQNMERRLTGTNYYEKVIVEISGDE